MQRLIGILMVLAGTALGGYLVLPAPAPAPQSGADKLAEVARIAAPADQSGPRPAAIAVATLAAAAPGVATAPTAAPDASRTRVFSAAAPLAPATPAPVATLPASTWTAVVTSEPNSTSQLKSSKPGDAETRAQLASDLQRELKRVGCYAGEVTGAWTPSTKRAMSTFMERVNATLPVDQPDYILLTLVQGHSAVACGADCPSGQVMSGAGHCVPQAVLAQASRKTQRDEERRATETRKAQQQELLAQEQRTAEAKRVADARKASADAVRMAAAAASERAVEKSENAARIAAAAAADKAAEKAQNAARVAAATAASQKALAAKAQQTAAVEPEKLPWLADDTPAAAQATTARATPPPGMMSIGGPHQATADFPASTATLAPNGGPRPPATVTIEQAPVAADSDAITPPAPRRATRPASRQAALVQQGQMAGMPGTKSGPAARRPITHTYRPAKIVRRPPPVIVYAPPRQKVYYYASNSGGGKARRGQPRAGTPHYNLMQSLGGIY